MTFKKQLHDLISSKGYVSIDEVHAFAKDLGHKEATAERELRSSRSPNIITVKRDNGTIKGYMTSSPILDKLNEESLKMKEARENQTKLDNLQTKLL